MSWPNSLTGWLTYLRKFRRRSSSDQALLAGLADIQARVTDIWSALDATRTQREPRVPLAFEEVKAAAERISEVIDEFVTPEGLAETLLEERLALRATLRTIQHQLHRLRLVSGIFLSRKVLPIDAIVRVTRGVRSYRVRANDTLGSIAAQELQDRARWPELAVLNRLTWPYIGDREEHPDASIVEAGEEIFLPAEPQGSVATSTAPPDPSGLYGVDIDLTTRRGQVTFQRGDVALVAGVDNIRQAVNHRVLSARGSLALHPQYGSLLYRWVGSQGVPELLRVAYFDYLRAVLEDPRIAVIDKRSGSLDGTTLALSCEAVAVGHEQPIRLNVVLPSVGSAA